jgi:zinc transport system substrate-binding protein
MIFRSFLASMLASLLPLSAAAQPHVVVSVAPVHSLVSGVMAGVAEPVLLYPATRSPHIQPLSPSAVKMLVNSDLVVRIGIGYEVALDKFIDNMGNHKLVDLVSDKSGIKLLGARAGGLWESGHVGDLIEIDRSGTGLGHLQIDPHIWLSTYNAAEIVKLVGQKLMQVDAGNSAIYAANMNRMLQRLDTFRLQLQRRLEIVKDRPYLVMHDAYQYFEQEYTLSVAGSVSVDAQRMPGARRIREIKQAIASEGITCIFLEPQLSRSMVETLANDMSMTVGELDPLGTGIDPGAELWFEIMTNLAGALVECLAPT